MNEGATEDCGTFCEEVFFVFCLSGEGRKEEFGMRGREEEVELSTREREPHAALSKQNRCPASGTHLRSDSLVPVFIDALDCIDIDRMQNRPLHQHQIRAKREGREVTCRLRRFFFCVFAFRISKFHLSDTSFRPLPAPSHLPTNLGESIFVQFDGSAVVTEPERGRRRSCGSFSVRRRRRRCRRGRRRRRGGFVSASRASRVRVGERFDVSDFRGWFFHHAIVFLPERCGGRGPRKGTPGAK